MIDAPSFECATGNPARQAALTLQPFNASTTFSQNITNFNKNTSMDNQPWSAITNCKLVFYVNSAPVRTIQFPPKVHRINDYPSTGCKKIQPNIAKYRVFGTPGGPPLFYPLLAPVWHRNPLSRNAFLNSSFKMTHSKLPHFCPKNMPFFHPFTDGHSGKGGRPQEPLPPQAPLMTVKRRQARSTDFMKKKIPYFFPLLQSRIIGQSGENRPKNHAK